jgi:radical SAM superfamily enzyme YgiQ (UPF0313 family)
MRVLLISTYESGHQPLGLASPAAHILDAGFPVQCADLAVESFPEREVLRADFIGISVPMHTALRLGVRAARCVRALNDRCHVSFYGLYAAPHGESLLRDCADSVVGGEYEASLAHLVSALAGHSAELPEGVWTRARRGAPFLGRQAFRLPARAGLPPLERYARLRTADGELRVAGYVEASRGCAHRCRHCPITPVYEGRLRIVPEDLVLEDVATLVGMGARHVTFGDPDFLNGVRHSMQIAQRLHERFPGVTFDVTAKIEHILEHRALVPELGRLGCMFIVSALESLNDRILENFAKGHTAQDAVEALDIARRAGIALRPSLVAFTPWTTIDDYLDVLDFVERYDIVDHVAPVQFAIRLLLPPGSWLLERSEIHPYLGELDEENFTYRWTHPDPRMDRLHRQVSAIVEAATHSGEDALVTFYRIRAAALATAAGRGPCLGPLPAHQRRPSPSLTEPWFC